MNSGYLTRHANFILLLCLLIHNKRKERRLYVMLKSKRELNNESYSVKMHLHNVTAEPGGDANDSLRCQCQVQ